MTYEDGKTVKWHDITSWPVLGQPFYAISREHAVIVARGEHGGRPVIEQIDEPIHYVGEH